MARRHSRFRRGSVTVDEMCDPIDAINDAAKLCRSISLTFLLLLAISAAMAVSADDQVLLLGTTITIPPFGLKVPVFGFFTVAPWAIVILHIHLTLKLHELKYRVKEAGTHMASNRTRLFIYEPILWEVQEPGPIKVLNTIWLLGSLILGPLLVLLYLQIEFLDFQSEAATWTQRVAIWADVFVVFALLKAMRWWSGFQFLVTSLAVLVVVTSLVFSVRGGKIDWQDATPAPPPSLPFAVADERNGNGQPETVNEWITKFWINSRTLDLSGKALIPNTVSPEVLASLIRDENGFASKWAEASLGLDLRGRNLRDSNFNDTNMIAARISGEEQGFRTDLSGARFRNARIRYSNLSGANLSNADLTNATVSGAEFRHATLRHAVLNGANLAGADLDSVDASGSFFWFSTLIGTNLQLTDLMAADFSGAHLSGANLTAANLTFAEMSSAVLVGTNLRVGVLAGTNFSDSDLSLANLTAAKFSILEQNVEDTADALREVHPELATEPRETIIEGVKSAERLVLGSFSSARTSQGVFHNKAEDIEGLETFLPRNSYPVALASALRVTLCGSVEALTMHWRNISTPTPIQCAVGVSTGVDDQRYAIALAKEVTNNICPAFEALTNAQKLEFEALANSS